MPVLHIHTNTLIKQPNEFLTQTSDYIARLLNKPESYVMVLISDKKPMIFADTQAPCAFLELKSLGLSETDTKDFSLALCSFLEDILSIDSSRIYIEFSSPARSMFGWNRSTF